MENTLPGIRTVLFAAAALAPFASKAIAVPVADDQQARFEALEREVQSIDSQVQALKRSRAGADSFAPDDRRRPARANVSFDNGRFSIASEDGRFTLSLRALLQYDLGYFAQGRNPSSVDLNSGDNFRRAQIGFVGTAWGDWSYNLTLDFGGNGTEKSGYIYTAYVEYDGLRPFGVRVGAYAPPAGLEDSTGSSDLLFLERPAASDIARNIAGSPSRDSITFFLQGERYLAALSYTGGKAGDAATFDEQQALVGRAAYLLADAPGFKWLMDADVSHVFKLADTAANKNGDTFSFSNGPELAIDATKTVNTGAIPASHVTEYGVETGLALHQFYGQGGYFHYGVARYDSALPDPDFDGWYALATWSLTGEEHLYNPVTASFRELRPVHPFGQGGWGAWEIKARFSDIDLNHDPLAGAALGAVTGGKQDVWTVGLNWYPANGLRFALDFDDIQVNHPNAPAADISSDAVALRTQLSL